MPEARGHSRRPKRSSRPSGRACEAGTGRIELVGEAASRLVWRDIRDCAPFADGGERPVWRISMAPFEAHRMVLALRMEAGADAFYDWQGGLIWLRMEAGPEAGLVRRLVRAHGGDIRLVRSTGEGTVFELELPEVGSQKTEVRTNSPALEVQSEPSQSRPIRRAG